MMIQETVLTGVCQCFRGRILVSSGTFLMSLALLMTSCYMKNFGWCMVFSFQLFCIAEEDTILTKCSWQQPVWSLCEKGFLAYSSAFFFSPSPMCLCSVGGWWGSHLWHCWRSKKHHGSPRGKQEKRVLVQQPSLLIALLHKWLGMLWKGWGLLYSVIDFIVFTWADGMGEALLVTPALWGKAMALQALKKQRKISKYAGMRNRA